MKSVELAVRNQVVALGGASVDYEVYFKVAAWEQPRKHGRGLDRLDDVELPFGTGETFGLIVI